MCRFVVYKGKELKLASIVTQPKHSVIHQTYARYLPDIANNISLSKDGYSVSPEQPHTSDSIQENQSDPSLVFARNAMINADGFGVGWYSIGTDEPCVFASTQPAANNRNLRRLSNHIKSPLIFAHLRAASEHSPVTETNCHPFQFGRLLWMHNGSVPDWPRVKKCLVSHLSQISVALIEGTTDSEHFGALFVDCLPGRDPNGDHSADVLRQAMLKTICIITCAARAHEPQSSSLNFAVTDGRTVIATRFRDHDSQEPPSLYYTTASDYSCEDGEIKLSPCSPDQLCNAIIVASEPLTFSRKCWTLVPKNHMIVVSLENKLTTQPINLENPAECFAKWKQEAVESS